MSIMSDLGAYLKTKYDGLVTLISGKENAFTKNTAFNKNFGTGATDVCVGSHSTDTSNPHGVTKTQVGLGNVTNDAQVTLATTQTISGEKTFSNPVTRYNYPIGAILLDDVVTADGGTSKRITWNDGGGNYNLITGEYYSSGVGSVAAVSGDGSARITLTSESSDGAVALMAAPINTTAGDKVSYNSILKITPNGVFYNNAEMSRYLLTDEGELTAVASSIDVTGLTGKSYEFYFDVKTAVSSGAFKLVINGDTTDANYNRQYHIHSGTTASAGSSANGYIGAISSLGQPYLGKILVRTFDNNIIATGYASRGTSTLEARTFSIRYSVTGTITSIGLNATVASSLDVGTKVKVYELEA